MNTEIDVNIDGRKLLAIPQDAHPDYEGNEPSGVFEIKEGKLSHGFITMNESDWEYDDRGDLSYIEVEAIAEAIQFSHRAK
ncbi:hypothetical protein [Mucilaginibacter ginkgonis]|uniref:Uncharacterized protein n=1 Tax=Mucilaginibacter ginkgonis TaxID=2682091 RepID=A0A6I4HWW0_9SPHI|nr:hypothetical protein [Mucilaginibacter ginkgonis]QQL49914.1 hypothetical protein GO620_000235 [Mucilaginibacter ginkgonis]